MKKAGILSIMSSVLSTNVVNVKTVINARCCENLQMSESDLDEEVQESFSEDVITKMRSEGW
jgi:hypothetical protein